MVKIKFGAGYAVLVNNEAVHLTKKEHDILKHLAAHKGVTQTKEAIMTSLYQYKDEPELKIIDVFTCKLRKKLKAVTDAPVIETTWGKGYYLRGDCEIEFDKPVMTICLSMSAQIRLENLILASDKTRDEVVELVFNKGAKCYEDALWAV